MYKTNIIKDELRLSHKALVAMYFVVIVGSSNEQ